MFCLFILTTSSYLLNAPPHRTSVHISTRPTCMSAARDAIMRRVELQRDHERAARELRHHRHIGQESDVSDEDVPAVATPPRHQLTEPNTSMLQETAALGKLNASTPVLEHRTEKPLELAFTAWREQQISHELVHREVNRLAHPDVPLWLIFEGIAQPVVLRGSATTDELHDAASHLHSLDANQKLRFLLNGRALPLGVAVSESALANTRNLEVRVVPCQWPVKRNSRSSYAATGTAIAATRVRHRATRVDVTQHLRSHRSQRPGRGNSEVSGRFRGDSAVGGHSDLD
jgi:hypothetical protein